MPLKFQSDPIAKDFARFDGKTSYRLVNRGPDGQYGCACIIIFPCSCWSFLGNKIDELGVYEII